MSFHPRIRNDGTAGAVLAAISNAATDFRTTDSLVHELAIPRATLIGFLDELWHDGKIRHPVGWERNLYTSGRNEAEWWRYTAHGYTRREKWRMISALSDGSPSGRY